MMGSPWAAHHALRREFPLVDRRGDDQRQRDEEAAGQDGGCSIVLLEDLLAEIGRRGPVEDLVGDQEKDAAQAGIDNRGNEKEELPTPVDHRGSSAAGWRPETPYEGAAGPSARAAAHQGASKGRGVSAGRRRPRRRM